MDAAADQKGKLEGEGRHKRQDSQAGVKGRRQKAEGNSDRQGARQKARIFHPETVSHLWNLLRLIRVQLAQLAESKQHPRNESPQLQNQEDDLQSWKRDEQGYHVWRLLRGNVACITWLAFACSCAYNEPMITK